MIKREDILWLAELARLKLTEQEVVKFSTELEDILRFVEELKQVDTKGVEPTHHATGVRNITRDDAVTPDNSFKEKLLAEAPMTSGGNIKVRAILEEYK